MQEFSHTGGAKDMNEYAQIYQVEINKITLRQLLLFLSLYVCKSSNDIIDLVNDQPDPSVFYNSFLELDGGNMVSILSFDSQSLEYLLHDDFDDYFTEEIPIFYKNKIAKGSS